MKKLLKKLSYVAIVSLTIATVQAQDAAAHLHMQFENNLNATGGFTFEVDDPDSDGHLIIYNNATPQEGSYSLDFSSYAVDGTGAYTDNVSIIDNNTKVQIRSTSNLGIIGTDALTLSAWIRYDDILDTTNGSHTIVTIGDPYSGAQGRITFTLAAANNKLSAAVGGGNINHLYADGTSIEDGNWHQVAITYPSGGLMSDIKFYIDGVVVSNDGGNKNPSPVMNLAQGLVYVGSDGKTGGTKWFDGGGIDDLRIYNYELSAAEITTIFGGAYLSVGDVAFGENELKAFPNAVVDILHIKTASNSALEINVFDISGKSIIRTSGNSVDMRSLASGLYIVKVRADNKVANLKILKK